MKSLRRFWMHLHARWLRRHRHMLTITRLQELDARGLRDLGLDRSEIRSIAAEASGLAERQRLERFQPYY